MEPAKLDALLLRIRLAVEAEVLPLVDEIERLEVKVATSRAAIFWALGVRGPFPIRKEGDGAYHWRKELRERASITAAELNAEDVVGQDTKETSHECGRVEHDYCRVCRQRRDKMETTDA